MSTAPVPMSDIPLYLRNASPIPADKRTPWYMNTAPTYAGIFLWIAFYKQLGVSLTLGSLASVLIGVVVAGLICHAFFYFVPGMLGMKTGLPLYIVGTSTFGTKGGYFIPGIFMGLLQIGWYSVATYFATTLIMDGLGLPSTVFYPMAIVWGVVFAVIGALGIGYVARMSQFFPIVPILMLLIGAVMALGSLGNYHTPAPLPGNESPEPFSISGIATWVTVGSLLMIHMVVGFFGTAGAVGADFCSNNRSEKDVQLGGYTGIWLATIFAAGLAVITVAGAHGEKTALLADPIAVEKDKPKTVVMLNPPADGKGTLRPVLYDLQAKGEDWNKLTVDERKALLADAAVKATAWDQMTKEQRATVAAARNGRFDYDTALRSLNTSVVDGKTKEGFLAGIMLILFAIGSMAPACFCSFIIGNSLSTMLGMPKSRIPITLAGAGVGVLIALTGAPAHLAPIFGLVGASFGPVIGAMIADYYLNGGQWPGPREGVNVPGYAAWFIGFLVGISNNQIVTNLLGRELVADYHPTGVYALFVGMIVYVILARVMGLPARLEGVVRTEHGKG